MVADPANRPCGLARCAWRPVLIAFGWINVATGAVGLVVPGLPTTVFLLVALWAFSRSSERFHAWLYRHPRLGRTIRAWHEHRVIPPRAKLMAVGTMSASLACLTVFAADGWVLPVAVGAVMAAVAGYILTRPGAPPLSPWFPAATTRCRGTGSTES